MIGYVTLGTNMFEKAAEFYDELFATIGAGRLMAGDTFIAWSTSPSTPAVSIIRPYDGKPATVGNGVMVAIGMNSTAKVDAFHAKALQLGGTDEGAPGPRGNNFYAGYFRDLDGNKLNAFCMTGE
ncbi:MAG: VOC family protein [Gammaproteobacteria bacterium]|nr:VOC family protein [Gammaproteobacteria bacterium]MDH3362530.1 VOC family protein [Gammaproteobacteria bacterium]MDH3480322.1 VOC family protein [Gammaproteobacteria bacterium]